MNNTIRILMRKRNRIHHKAVRTHGLIRLLRKKALDEIRISKRKHDEILTAKFDYTILPVKWWKLYSNHWSN